MSRLLLTLAVDNAPDGKAIGVKEAIAMDLEKYGDVKVLRVEAQEPEQMRFSGVAPPRPNRTASEPATPLQAGQAPARPRRPGSCPLACCHTCAHYRAGQGKDERGTLYWGWCANSGRTVYRLVDRCGAWKEVR